MSVTRVDFDPDKKRIEDIFDGSLKLVIPRYQRTYSWPKEKAEEFYDDFIEEAEKPEDNLAFLGTILFALSDNGTLEIIDGQQRLITVTILFAVLRDILKKMDTVGTSMAAEQLQGKITITSNFGSSYSKNDGNQHKLQVGLEIEKIFETMIYKSCEDIKSIKLANTAERKVFDAYWVFHKKLNDMLNRPGLHSDQRLALAGRVVEKVNSIDYIDIRVTNKEVAYNLFESHNAKGIALAKTDLIKNYYFGRLSGSDTDKNKKMDEWDALIADLTENTSNMLPDRFFYYMLESYLGNFSSASLYRKIKPMMDDYQRFFALLKRNIKFMIQLKNSDTGDRDFDRVLLSLNDKLRVNQCFIVLLAVYRNQDKLSQNSCKKIFKLIEEFTYLYSGITSGPGNALEKVYSKHAKQLEDDLSEYGAKNPPSDIEKERITGKLLKNLHDDLSELTPSYSTFLESFAALRYTNRTNRAMIRYSFEKIEHTHSKGIVILGESFTLDHIIPQKKANSEIYQSIGNLSPMSSEDNVLKGAHEVNENDYMDISNFYSVKRLNQQLEGSQKFDEDKIKERIEYLARYCYYDASKSIVNGQPTHEK